ncbi:MAG: excinuclease ABC subunit A, partial [Verrucomicrobia bacterium]|nr:excinuclease ABC subunit A [Verrucomicrobiota bacterium]
WIEGLSPAIAIEQRSSLPNPRSTVATTTEIYDYLRLLFSSIGMVHDPVTGDLIKRQSPQQISDQIMALPSGTRMMLLAPLVWEDENFLHTLLQRIQREGFVRLRKDGEIVELEKLEEGKKIKSLEIVVDRLVLQEGVEERLRDSLETTLRWGKNQMLVLAQESGSSDWKEYLFSTDFCNPKTGFTMEALTPKHFSFNSPKGACSTCEGIGSISGKTCSSCYGRRLRSEILSVTVAGKNREWNIDELCRLSIAEAVSVFEQLRMTESERHLVKEVLRGITTRLQFLKEVGLGYLALQRESGTLSGGEVQRMRLATQMGAGLSGVLYVLDEPSIGLHQRDHARLLQALVHLRDLGNSVIVVEHDEETIKMADHIIDLGPGAGLLGGEIVGEGTLEEIKTTSTSLTGDYLSGRKTIQVSAKRLLGEKFLTIVGAREHNLKKVTASFPVGLFTCVTGVSGSGKSTLIHDVLYRGLAKQLHGAKAESGRHEKILGGEFFDRVIMIDQAPIGRTSRSNPATYTGVFDIIRDLFVQLPAARMRGYHRGQFSFNVKGGRCEACHGEGIRHVEMHFLPDVMVLCEACEGKRFHRDLLEITYKGRSIADVLEMRVQEAQQFFSTIPKITQKLRYLVEVGLGYLKLGQSATTLSGGEAQRLKLATELGRVTAMKNEKTLYILDEPTTGLHFSDIQQLLNVLVKLRDAGSTLIVIEHHLDVIKCADWLIELGPEGGDGGGEVVIAGKPEEVAACEKSATGIFLKKFFPVA